MGNHIVVMNEDRELIGAFFCFLFDPSKRIAYAVTIEWRALQELIQWLKNKNYR